MIKICMQTGNRNCAATIYAPDQVKYVSTKLVAVYAAKTFGIALEIFSGLQCFLLISTEHIMETETIYTYGYYKHNMELDIDGINKLYIINIRLGYYENKRDEYNRNKIKYTLGNKLKNKNICYCKRNKVFRIEKT
eukprot:140047_1